MKKLAVVVVVLILGLVALLLMDTLQVEAQWLGECVPWCEEDAPIGGARPTGQTGYNFTVKNSAPFRICVAYQYYVSGSSSSRVGSSGYRLPVVTPSSWVSKGWYCLNPGESRQLLTNYDNAYVYWYAKDDDRNYNWYWASNDNSGARFWTDKYSAFTITKNVDDSLGSAPQVCAELGSKCDSPTDLELVKGIQEDLRVRNSVNIWYGGD